MRRSKRSSSESSTEERISKSKKSSRYRSSSSSSDRSKHHSKSKRNRRHRSSSSERSRTKSKRNRKDKRRSSSSSLSRSRSRHIDSMEREKNYEFNEGINEVYKNETNRRNQITKLDEEGGGFKPKSFKSSRSTKKPNDNSKPKLTKEQEHENVIFGAISSSLNINELKTISPAVEFSIVSSNSKSIMHENLFEDISVKEKRWRAKLLELLKNN